MNETPTSKIDQKNLYLKKIIILKMVEGNNNRQVTNDILYYKMRNDKLKRMFEVVKSFPSQHTQIYMSTFTYT